MSGRSEARRPGTNGRALSRSARRALRAFLSGFVVLAAVISGGAAWGSWTADAGASARATTRTVAIQVTSSDLDGAYSNRHETLVRAGSFLVTNIGQSGGEVALTVRGTGALAGSLPVAVWRADSGSCATEPARGVVRGTWAAVDPPAPGRLESGASARYCVRTAVTLEQRQNLASPTGSQAAEAVIAATLTADGWGPRGAQVGARQETKFVYPLAPSDWVPKSTSPWHTVVLASNTSRCLDIADSSHTPGANVIPWGCSKDSNQVFRTIPVSGADNLITLQPMHAPEMRIGVQGGRQVLFRAASAQDPATQWYVQQLPGDRTQLVSASDGRCLNFTGNAANEITMPIDCSDATAVMMGQEGINVSIMNGYLTFSTTVNPASRTFRLFLRSGRTWQERGMATAKAKWITATSRVANGYVFAQIRDQDGNVIFGDLELRVTSQNTVQAVKGFGLE